MIVVRAKIDEAWYYMHKDQHGQRFLYPSFKAPESFKTETEANAAADELRPLHSAVTFETMML